MPDISKTFPKPEEKLKKLKTKSYFAATCIIILSVIMFSSLIILAILFYKHWIVDYLITDNLLTRTFWSWSICFLVSGFSLVFFGYKYSETVNKIEQSFHPRPWGLAEGDFTVPDDFDAPLPDDIIDSFYQ